MSQIESRLSDRQKINKPTKRACVRMRVSERERSTVRNGGRDTNVKAKRDTEVQIEREHACEPVTRPAFKRQRGNQVG